MSPFDKRMHYKNIHSLIFGLWRLSTNLSNTPRIGICIFKSVFNVWHILKKVCQCNNILNNFWGNKEELNWSMLEIF